MAEFDFAAWVSRAQAFTIATGRLPGAEVRSATVAAPITESEMRAVEGALGVTFPASLQAFFTRGAAAVNCSFVLEPQGQALEQLREVLPDETRIFGGARLSHPSELADSVRAAGEWARETWIADSPGDRTIWESALPFIGLDNGDYLALDLRPGGSDPPVAYLSHDDESFLLAPNLVVFLAAWERLCYVGPEEWLLRPFTGDAGHLDAESDRAARLRTLFRQ